MKGFIVLLLCLFCVFCVSGCGGYTLQGNWKGGEGEHIKMEFRSDGSILEEGQKAEGLTWHGDYICLKADTKKIRDARINALTNNRAVLVSQPSPAQKKEAFLKDPYNRVGNMIIHGKAATKESIHKYAEERLKRDEEQLANQLKSIDQQLEDLKNGKVMEEGCYHFPVATGVDKKDICESADKVEFRIHWVDADHFDLGSTSFSRVKETK